jgi:DNA-binding winged helix-turn-helix (wHTH) protein
MIGSRATAKRTTVSNSAESHHWEYVFGPYRLDPGREMLRCDGKVIALPSRLFVLLRSLVTADGNVVSREDLSSLIWPDGIASEGNLSQHIYMLRLVLGESRRECQFIMTVHGKGFRFAAPVTLVAAAPPFCKRVDGVTAAAAL